MTVCQLRRQGNVFRMDGFDTPAHDLGECPHYLPTQGPPTRGQVSVHDFLEYFGVGYE